MDLIHDMRKRENMRLQNDRPVGEDTLRYYICKSSW